MARLCLLSASHNNILYLAICYQDSNDEKPWNHYITDASAEVNFCNIRYSSYHERLNKVLYV